MSIITDGRFSDGVKHLRHSGLRIVSTVAALATTLSVIVSDSDSPLTLTQREQPLALWRALRTAARSLCKCWLSRTLHGNCRNTSLLCGRPAWRKYQCLTLPIRTMDDFGDPYRTGSGMPISEEVVGREKRLCYSIERRGSSYFCLGSFLGRDKQSG